RAVRRRVPPRRWVGRPHRRGSFRVAHRVVRLRASSPARSTLERVSCGPGTPLIDECIRVVICDDHALFRRGLMMVLEDQDDIEVVAEAANGAEAVETATHLAPDVVLMDVRMPELDGI